MVVEPMIRLNLPSYYTKEKIIVTLENRVISNISINSQQSIKSLTMISLNVDFDDTKVVDFDTTETIESDLFIKENVGIYITNHNARAYNVKEYYYSVETLDSGDKILNINIKLEEGATIYSESIDYIDPVLMFYRKILPYDKYEVYGVFEKTLANLGTIDKITYDTEINEYKIYSKTGIVINYNTLPLVNPTKVNIEGTQYTNPPTAIWILDKSNIDDLIWMNKIEIHKIELDNTLFNTFSDWVESVNLHTININSITISVKSINKKIHFDFEHFQYLDPNEVIYSYTTDIISTMPFPFRDLYLRVNEQYTLSELVINYSDTENTYNSDVKITGYFITDSKI